MHGVRNSGHFELEARSDPADLVIVEAKPPEGDEREQGAHGCEDDDRRGDALYAARNPKARSKARRDGLGIYRLIDPSLTSDETLTTVLQFMSDSFSVDESTPPA